MHDRHEKSAWLFVGECGLNERNDPPPDADEYLFRLRVGLGFLKAAFGEPPAGCVLDVLHATSPHGEGEFPIIAVGFDGDAEHATRYALPLERALAEFDQAVAWDRLSYSNLRASRDDSGRG